MKSVIWKYKIENKIQVLLVPHKAKLLSCQIQNNKICVWFLFDIENENNLVSRAFRTVYTGEPFDIKDNWEYITTVQNKYEVVYHVFEVIS